MQKNDLNTIQEAKEFLENKSIIATLTEYSLKPIERGLDKLPDSWKKALQTGTLKSIEVALDLTLQSLKAKEDHRIGPLHDKGLNKSRMLHNSLSAATGAVSGFFGGWTVALELSITTSLILRSMAVVAQGQNRDIFAKETQLELIALLYLGGPDQTSIQGPSRYFHNRKIIDALMFKSKSDLANASIKNITQGLAKGQAQALLKFFQIVSKRYGVAVGEKMIAQAIPVLGAVSGAGINLHFTDHFTKTADHHFKLKQLESIYGTNQVKEAYLN